MIELPTADSIRPSSDLAERLEVEYQTKEQGLGTQTKTLSSMDTSRGGALVGSTPKGDVVPILRNALALAASTFGKRRASFRDRFRLGFKDNKTEGYLKTCKRDDFGRSLPFERKAMIKKKDSLDRNICLEDTTGKRVPCNSIVPSKARAAKPNLTPPIAPKKIQKINPLPVPPVAAGKVERLSVGRGEAWKHRPAVDVEYPKDGLGSFSEGKPTYPLPSGKLIEQTVREDQGYIEPEDHVEVSSIPLSKLKFREGRKADEEMDEAMPSPEKIPPMTVMMKKGKFDLIEGHHRASSLERAGHEHVWAVVITQDGKKKPEVVSESVEATGDPFANRPTKPEERDPNAKLPVLPWKPPPPPLALNKGKGKVVRPKGELSNTKRGDKIEGLADKLSLRNILPQGKRSNVNVATEGSSIDREYDHSGKLCEIKACWTTATEYKPKPKKEEFEGKARFADIHKGDPVTTVVVVDEKTKKAYFYWHEGLTSKKLPIGSEPNGWNFMGEVSF